MTGTKILNYKITRLIGSGGMAKVYEGEHVNLGTKVAIKILDPVLASKGNIKERFRNEARIMAGLRHENIVQVLDYYEDDDKNIFAIIMELLEGDSLSDFVRQNGKLSKELVYDIMSKTLRAFDYAHKKGLIHRDVKPANLFITKDKNIKILDFGIAKIIGQDAELTSTGMQMGTPMYMSPEQVKDSKHIDQRSDIYSLGVMMYFMLTGKRPYDTNTNSNFDILNKIVNEPLPTLSEYPDLSKIIQKATAKDPYSRFADCDEFLKELINMNEDKQNSNSTLQNEVNRSFTSNTKKTVRGNVETTIPNKKMNNMEIKSLKPNRKRAFFAKNLIYAVILMNLIAFFYSSGNELIWDQAPERFILLSATINLLSVIIFIRWFRRAYYNLHIISRCKYSEGWAAGAWFVPILNFYRPYQIMKEMWEKIQEVLISKGIKFNRRDTSLVAFWWLLFLVGFISVDLIKELFDVDYVILRKIDDILLFIDVLSGAVTVYLINVYSSFEEALLESENRNVEANQNQKEENNNPKDTKDSSIEKRVKAEKKINQTFVKNWWLIGLVYVVIRLIIYLLK